MDTFWRWLERFRRLFFKTRVEQEVSDEMRFHLEMAARERIDRGMDPAEARRQATLEFGAVERYRAEAREARWGHRWDSLAQDGRYALRTLAASPGFTGVALFTLALGTGACIAVFTLVDALLLRPLPYGAPQDAVWIETSWAGSPRAQISPAEYLDYRDRLTDAFSAVGVYAFGTLNLGGDGEPVRLPAAALSAQVLPALGVAPAIGRGFTEQEELEQTQLVLLSDAFWRQRFAADRQVVGRTLLLDGSERQIIGVLPPGFRLPETLLSGSPAQVFAPLGIDPGQVTNRGSHYLSGVARIRTGVSRGTATAALEQLADGFGDEFPDAYPAEKRFRATAVPIAERIHGPVRTPLAVLATAVIFVLLVTCANVANLLLSRADRRERELALRAALGASRGRLARQIVVESTLLAAAGGALGLGVAHLVVRAFSQLPFDVPWLQSLGIDSRVLAFAAVLAPLSGVVLGLVAAVSLGRLQLLRALKEGARTATASARNQRMRRGLVIAEVALALVLLSGAGLLVRSFARLVDVDPGFRTDQVVTTRLSLPASQYPESEDRVGFFRELVPRLAELPAVQNAGAVTNLPLATRLGDMDFVVEGRPTREGAVEPAADWQVVTPGYFEAMGLRLLRGRTISATDAAGAPGVVVINETFAREIWPGEDALGKRFRPLGERTEPEVVEVIGIVRDVRHASLSQERRPQMYFAHPQFRHWGSGRAMTTMTLVVQTPLPAAELRAQIAETVHSLDADLPLAEVRGMAEVRRYSLALPWLLMSVMTAFSGVALVLSTVGIYGVMAFAVAKRLPELGIRMALGAHPRQIARLVLAQGAALTATGVFLGLAGALVTTRAIAGLLYEVSPFDPATWFAVTLLLAGTALAACYLPALRASRADLVELLRNS